MYPGTVLGKLVSAVFFLWGILMLALPIGVIGSSFAVTYDQETKRNMCLKEQTVKFNHMKEYRKAKPKETGEHH